LTLQTNLFLSYNIGKVKKYDPGKNSVSKYFNDINPIPVEGRPLYSIYSYKWGGLDPLTGDPQGYYDGKISKDYKSISESTNINGLVYNGPRDPVLFGSMINSISIKSITISCRFIFKFGHYFRKKSLSNDDLLAGEWGHKDYSQSWQRPGDEQFTNVPSLVFEPNGQRNDFYKNAAINVEKADHIRLQDIQVSYDLLHASKNNKVFQQLHLYFFMDNIGILWRANKSKLDPDVETGIQGSKRFTLGFNVILKQKH
jgi:hypothetical protein